MSTAVVTDPQLQNEALTTVERATALVVTNLEARAQAAELGVNVAGLLKKAVEWFAPMKRLADEAHKEICRKEKEITEPLEKAKKYLSKQIGEFDLETERQRKAEEARLQEEARLKAVAEAAQRAQDTAIADAIELEAQGDVKGAAAVLANPVPQEVYVPPVVIPRSVPKAAGVSSNATWTFRITDVNAIPREYMIPDEKAIRAVVKAMKNKTNIPGVEPYPEGAARFRA